LEIKSKAAGERVENIMVHGLPLVETNMYQLAVNSYCFDALLGLECITMDDRYYNYYEVMQDAGRIRAMIIQYVQEMK